MRITSAWNVGVGVFVILLYMVYNLPVVKLINIISRTNCVCNPHIVFESNMYLMCFDGCKISPVSDYLYNASCSHMSGLTIALCNGERYIGVKPELKKDEGFTVNIFLSCVKKLLMVLISTISAWFMQKPFLFVSSFVHSLMVSRSNLKCSKCDQKYLFKHVDCPTPVARDRTDLNLLFYLLLFFLVFIVSVKADDNIYNYYAHGNHTEIQILDKENYKQDFDVNGYLYTFVVKNSHLIANTVNISVITAPQKHHVDKVTWSCDGNSGCSKDHINKHGLEPSFYVKKVRDGFSCILTQATICGNCHSDHSPIGTKVIVSTYEPYIEIDVTHGNKTEHILITDFNTYIHKPYYVKPIQSLYVNTKEYLVVGKSVYNGVFCSQPAYGCFGPNYIKDDKHFKLVNPKVIDTHTADREFVLQHCDDPGVSDIRSLELTDHVYFNSTIIIPHSFGLISIGIPTSGKLIGDFCEREVVVKNIEVNGCFDCASGFEAKIIYKPDTLCGSVNCKIGNLKYKYYVNVDSDSITLHSYTDKPDTKIICNGYIDVVQLSKPLDSDYVLSSNHIHSEAGEIKHWNLFPLLFTDIKYCSLMCLIALISFYLLLRFFLRVTHFTRKLVYNREVIRMKKDDEYTSEYIVVGTAD
uniref:Glycoprotein n=1 Tax=Vitis emaravirus TaxID=2812031 RepID=A0A831ENV7_9VIRU|nr:glycoprotein precursor [Vitis emaravirus]